MKKVLFAVTLVAVALALPLAAETWKDVALVDNACSAKVKANPDSHTASCALQCEKSGFAVVSDGMVLKLDKAGNAKALAALKATKKTDHLRATVTGEKAGDTIKVTALTLD